MATHLEQARRRAERALDRLTRIRAELGKIDRAFADYQDAIAQSLGKSVDGMEDVHAILLHVCHAYAVTPGAILSRVRTADLVGPRHMAIGIAHVLTMHSCHKLGRMFRRDRRSILSAIEAHGRRLDTDAAYHRRFDEFIAALSPASGERRSA